VTDVVVVQNFTVTTAEGRFLLACPRLSAGRGRVIGLAGASGSGKTTLLRAMAGLLPPGSSATGTLTVADAAPLSLTGHRLREFRRDRVAYVGQDPASRLNPRLRVGSLLTEVAPGNRADHAQVLADLGLPHEVLRKRVHQLSGGQQRRVALARALVCDPAVLLLDEPTAGLDPALRLRFGELIQDRARQGTTMVIACHDHEWADRFADEIVDLDHGVSTVASAATNAPPTAGSPTVLRVVDLTVHIGPDEGSPLLAGIDLSVARGEAVGVVGDSGAGKTTLARAIAGLMTGTSGRISLHGHELPLQARGRGRERSRGLQLVPQDPLGTLNPARTVGATLLRPLRLRDRSVSRHALGAQIRALLQSVGLPSDFAERHPHELSGGQRQRVSLARALAAEPAVLVCDEITSALDPDSSASIMALVGSLRAERGLAVVVISHDLAVVAAHTTTALHLSGGRVVAYGPTADVLGGRLCSPATSP
jgi:peptide/nickel transport system ATP-binding protein